MMDSQANGDLGETKHCKNCKRDIGIQNFVMHEAHCARNIILCPKCEEPVPKTQLKEHQDQYHSLIACSLCKQKIEAGEKNDHEKDICPKRLVNCCYCDMDVIFDNLDEHENYCGTRTERCISCQRNVLIRDQARHESSNCSYPEVPPPPPSSFMPEISPPSYFPDNTFVRSEIARNLLINDIPLLSAEDDDLSFAKALSLESVGDFASNPFASRLESQASSFSGNLGLDRSRTALPCEFCGQPFNASQLQGHQFTCNAEMVGATAMPYSASGGFEDEDGIPCEFCDKLFPLDFLPYHQSECSVNDTVTPRFEPTDKRSLGLHAYSLDRSPTETDVAFAVPESASNEYESESNTCIPCEYCNLEFPLEQFDEHQLTCTAYPAPPPKPEAQYSQVTTYGRQPGGATAQLLATTNPASGDSKAHKSPAANSSASGSWKAPGLWDSTTPSSRPGGSSQTSSEVTRRSRGAYTMTSTTRQNPASTRPVAEQRAAASSSSSLRGRGAKSHPSKPGPRS